MEKSVSGCYYGSGNLRSDLPVSLDLCQIGRLPVEKMITRRYRLEEIHQGFADMEAGKNTRGVIIYRTPGDGVISFSGPNRVEREGGRRSIPEAGAFLP